MAKSISGNLRDLKLIDLLVLLCTKKDQWGKLVFSNNDEKAEIYIEGGKILHAGFQSMEGVDALYSLLTWKEGDFEFKHNVKPEKITINANTKQLLTDCLNKRKELTVIQELITDPNEIFKLSGRSTSGRISMSTEDLSIISYLDGTKNVKTIEKLSGKNRFTLYKTLYRFLSFDVITKVAEEEVKEEVKKEEKKEVEEKEKEIPESAGPVASKEVIKKIANYLKSSLGPSGGVILETCIEDIGYDEDNLPLNKMEELIKSLAKESKLDTINIRKAITEATGDTVTQDTAAVGIEFFETVEKRLKSILGPSAAFTLETCMEELGHKKSNFPVSKLYKLMEDFIQETGINKKEVSDIMENIKRIKESYDITYPTQPVGDKKKKGGIFSFFRRK